MRHIKGKTGDWEYVIGLEVHAQIKSKAKLFSSESTEFGKEPNENVSLIDAAMPGMLPVLNEYCLHQAIRTGLSFHGIINKYSAFDRKNYFYPDLPQGYQISQFYHPIVSGGEIKLNLEDGSEKIVRIERLHIEQDAGKSSHDQLPNDSLIDLNRSGVGLMEIVTKPDISSPEEAAEFVKKLRNMLRYLGSCDGDMEKGSLRCDANVSVRKSSDPLGTRCEIKNLNSTRNIVNAIIYEAQRQVGIIESNGVIDQETRLFDVSTGETRTMRSKEEAHDYRYFPDPDLLPVKISQDLIDDLARTLPELPDDKVMRYINDFGLNRYDAGILVADINTADYFDQVAKLADPKLSANWIITELFGRLNKASMELSESKITPAHLVSMINLITKGEISGKIAKTVFDDMFNTGEFPEEIVKKKGLIQLNDSSTIEPIIDGILSNNQLSVMEYQNGKEKLFGFFVGQVMKKTGGKANPGIVNALLKEKLQK
ncbi:MAG: Asp-tRNA(Asn)/Glu-tRNA(Gln) amidotransferase subunit GatB [Rickettsiaceae bacterium]